RSGARTSPRSRSRGPRAPRTPLAISYPNSAGRRRGVPGLKPVGGGGGGFPFSGWAATAGETRIRDAISVAQAINVINARRYIMFTPFHLRGARNSHSTEEGRGSDTRRSKSRAKRTLFKNKQNTQ